MCCGLLYFPLITTTATTTITISTIFIIIKPHLPVLVNSVEISAHLIWEHLVGLLEWNWMLWCIAVSTPVLYSGGPRVNFQLGDQLSWWTDWNTSCVFLQSL
jgi:hypothetical protein